MPGKPATSSLTTAGRPALSGDWQFGVSRQGRPLAASSDWESICWHSDADVDYLELQIELDEGVILQRHLVLAREDRFLLLADAVLGPGPGGLEYRGLKYRGTVPLAAAVEFRPAQDTREGLLADGTGSTGFSRNPRPPKGGTTSGKSLAKVLPIALPEWRRRASRRRAFLHRPRA